METARSQPDGDPPARLLALATGLDPGPEGDAAIVLGTGRFEAFRWRPGRPSRRPRADLDRTGDPSPVLGQLVVFGAATTGIDERGLDGPT